MGDENTTTTDTMLSQNYSLGDLCVTEQNLANPNLPSTQDQMNNLTQLAQSLDQLIENIGPIKILSGFRTQELQTALREGGNPTSPGTSFHEVGRAIDFYPTTMPVGEYFARLLANEGLKAQFAEIAFKPNQNAIHLAVNVPGDTRIPKILKLNPETMAYNKMSDVDIEMMVAPYVTPEIRTVIVDDAKSAGGINVPVLLAVAGFGLAIILKKKK